MRARFDDHSRVGQDALKGTYGSRSNASVSGPGWIDTFKRWSTDVEGTPGRIAQRAGTHGYLLSELLTTGAGAQRGGRGYGERQGGEEGEQQRNAHVRHGEWGLLWRTVAGCDCDLGGGVGLWGMRGMEVVGDTGPYMEERGDYCKSEHARFERRPMGARTLASGTVWKEALFEEQRCSNGGLAQSADKCSGAVRDVNGMQQHWD
ncbi:hypothetical protein FGB62_9g35 [Gracilaria domingensis]|nr:hypothetical protein FGB62_9g35 [Gracilaria domingensis]